MNAYGTMLKRLVAFSGSKQATIAEVVGYDVSYVSKWCNQSKLPSSRMAPDINRALADHFAKEIIAHGDTQVFFHSFAVEPQTASLDADIYLLLKNSYAASCTECPEPTPDHESDPVRVLTSSNEIDSFFNFEFPEILISYHESLDILCTFDVGSSIYNCVPDHLTNHIPMHDMHVKIGLNLEKLHAGAPKTLTDLYQFINAHPQISFDFYDDSQMNRMNTIVVRHHIAILCTFDHHNRIVAAVIMTAPSKVQSIYAHTLPQFRRTNLLIHSTDSNEFYRYGYRTDFYAQNNYELFLTKGFEYLLPPSCWSSITDAALQQHDGPFMARLISQLQITWEEIFEKGNINFYLLPSTLSKYIEDGEIIFADVVCRMTPDERRQHIRQVLALTAKNPNIHFYILNEATMPIQQNAMKLSIFSNQKMMFLKNTTRYHSEIGPYFYTILNDQIIKDTSATFQLIQQSESCKAYEAVTLNEFYDRYRILIDRMINLSEDFLPY